MKYLWGILAVIGAAFALAACGGGDSSTTPTDNESNGTASEPSSDPKALPHAQRGEQASKSPSEQDSSDSQENDAESARSEAARERKEYELERYGRPSQRSASFRRSARHGVLKHLPEFGAEASADERAAAQSVLVAYLAAVDKSDWGKACGHLLPFYVKSLEESARAGSGAPRDCAEALSRLLKEAMKQPGARYPIGSTTTVASFRIEPYPPERAEELDVEKAGFALIHGPEGTDYYATLTRSDGQWSLTAPMPHPLAG